MTTETVKIITAVKARYDRSYINRMAQRFGYRDTFQMDELDAAVAVEFACRELYRVTLSAEDRANYDRLVRI